MSSCRHLVVNSDTVKIKRVQKVVLFLLTKLFKKVNIYSAG